MPQKRVAICFIGTNEYYKFFWNFYTTAKDKFLPDCEKTFLFFTDKKPPKQPDIKLFHIDHLPWPFITLFRFKFLKEAEEELKNNYDWFVYVDADMVFNKEIKSTEFFNESKDLFGVQHPGFLNQIGSFEHNPFSLACVDSTKDDLSTYWQGCIWGGKPEAVIQMVNELDNRIEKDLLKNIIAVWHDESHMNKYFCENKNKVHTLDSGFAYPELWNIPFEKKIIHVHKNNKELQK